MVEQKQKKTISKAWTIGQAATWGKDRFKNWSFG